MLASEFATGFARVSSVAAPRRVLNRITGTILRVGANAQRTLHVRTDEGGVLDLEVEESLCPPELRRFFAAGGRVLLAVDAMDVKLATFRPPAPGACNEWVGRVVLVERERDIVTVKIRGQQITLKSLGADIGQGRMLQVWDRVALSVAPDALCVMPLGTCARLRRRLLISSATDAGERSDRLAS